MYSLAARNKTLVNQSFFAGAGTRRTDNSLVLHAAAEKLIHNIPHPTSTHSLVVRLLASAQLLCCCCCCCNMLSSPLLSTRWKTHNAYHRHSSPAHWRTVLHRERIIRKHTDPSVASLYPHFYSIIRGCPTKLEGHSVEGIPPTTTKQPRAAWCSRRPGLIRIPEPRHEPDRFHDDDDNNEKLRMHSLLPRLFK